MDLITRRRAIESLGALLAAFSPKGKSAASTTARNRELAIQYSDVVFAFEFTPAEGRRFFGTPTVPAEAVAEYLAPWPTTEVERRFLARFDALDATCA